MKGKHDCHFSKSKLTKAANIRELSQRFPAGILAATSMNRYHFIGKPVLNDIIK
jgi:hypothetical protein